MKNLYLCVCLLANLWNHLDWKHLFLMDILLFKGYMF